jgi:arylsulfatase A-like enzyme/Tfp pilus assembly protein PilF
MAPGKGRYLVLLALLLAGVVLVLWFRRPPRSDQEARARIATLQPASASLNVVVVTMDTTRADRLGCYGFKGIETPNLDALARDGVVFENETATVPLTLPSHTSIFTGLVPPHHGVRDNGGFVLAEDKTTLAERLKAAGYATGAFVAAWVLEGRWGLNQGFDHYGDQFELSKYKVVSLGTVQKPGDEVMDEAVAWLSAVKSKKFFAWVHLYDPHTPYEPPEPFKSRYPGQPYLGEIAYTDKVVGRLVDWLRDNQVLDRTLVVVTADHGESLGEHGEASHSYFIYDSTTRVPLIVRTPWGLQGRVKAQTSAVDVFPTILDLVGLPPEPGIDGKSAARLLFDPGATEPRVAYSETYFPRYHFGWQHLRSLRDGAWQFVEAPTPELYDLAHDPAETANVYKANSRRGEAMRAQLEALAGGGVQKAPEKQKLDPDTLQRLAALGYVGNVVDVDPEAKLPDPKDKLPIFQLMNAAKAEAQDEKTEEAVAKMRKAIALDPGIVDAHLTLGTWLAKLNRADEAIAEYKKALELKPDNDLAMLNLAYVYRGRGQFEAALEGYRAVLRQDAKNTQARYQLATLYLDLGRRADAEAEFKATVAANPEMGAAWNSLGALAFVKGDLDDADRLVRRGLELEKRVRFGSYNLARIAEARGERPKAEELYRRELEIYPDHGKARFNLAQLLRERGDRTAYLAELRIALEKSPEFGPPYFFLGREELEQGHLDAARDLARRGLDKDSSSPVAPLGHYVLADVLNRQGRAAEAQAEVAAARRLEAAQRARPEPVL